MADPMETFYGDDYEDFEEDDGPDEIEQALQECGQTGEGGCLMAGTEHCDFDCPYRDVNLFDGDDEKGEIYE